MFKKIKSNLFLRSIPQKTIRLFCNQFEKNGNPQNNQFSDSKPNEKINHTQFSEKLIKMETENFKKENPTNQFSFWNLLFPTTLSISAVAVFMYWISGKAKQDYRNFTLCDSSLSISYMHNLLTSAIGFQTKGHFGTYFPILVFSLFGLAKRVNTFYFLTSFLANTFLTSGVTFLYEKYDDGFFQKKMIPKTNGSSTSLFYLFLFSGLFPHHRFLGMRYFPFLFFPMCAFFYEFNEFQEVYVKEVCRPAHLMACLNGLIFAILFRKIGI